MYRFDTCSTQQIPTRIDEAFCMSWVFLHVLTRLFRVFVDLAEWTSKIRLHASTNAADSQAEGMAPELKVGNIG